MDRLKVVLDELKVLYTDLAFARAEELRAKRDAWESSTESVSYRDKLATYSASIHTIQIWNVEAEIKALTDEKFFLYEMLRDHAV